MLPPLVVSVTLPPLSDPSILMLPEAAAVIVLSPVPMNPEPGFSSTLPPPAAFNDELPLAVMTPLLIMALLPAAAEPVRFTAFAVNVALFVIAPLAVAVMLAVVPPTTLPSERLPVLLTVT